MLLIPDSNMLNKSHLTVNIFSGAESSSIPKLIQIITQKRTVLFHQWATSNQIDLGYFNAGLYLVKISLPSGVTREQVVKLTNGSASAVNFELDQISPGPEMEWAYFAKPNTSYIPTGSSGERYDLPPIPVELRVLTAAAGSWIADGYVSESRLINTISVQGEVLHFTTTKSMQMLQITAAEYPSQYVRLPPSSDVRVFLRRQISSQPLRNPVEVFISTDNWQMEALLQLIKNGRMDKAEDLLSVANAEELLRGKYVDENAAAVGGYYLYKAGAYRKTRNWARNLANDFPFLPDGAIIYASQLVNKKRPGKKIISESREYFLVAADRGIPVYTMGFRLLIDGLNKMSNYFGKSDEVIERALEKFSDLQRMIDYNRDLTTLNALKGTIPGDPMQVIFKTIPGNVSDGIDLAPSESFITSETDVYHYHYDQEYADAD